MGELEGVVAFGFVNGADFTYPELPATHGTFELSTVAFDFEKQGFVSKI